MLTINNLSYYYRTQWIYKRIEVLKDISLSLKEGEAFGFLGANGSGKTTTIKCILGLATPRSGSIEVGGQSSSSTKARALIGYLAEQPYYYDHLTVEETLLMYAALAGVPSSKRKEAAREALSRVNLIGRNNSKLRTLSKGLMQRVGMAQAIVAKPKLLILDEPFSGLDPIGRKEFRELFLSLKKDGTTIFMSSHILSDVELICDRASILVEGKLKAVINISEIESAFSNSYELVLRNYSSVEDKIKKLGANTSISSNTLRAIFSSKEAATEALKESVKDNATVVSYSFSHASLEEIFVKYSKQ